MDDEYAVWDQQYGGEGRAPKYEGLSPGEAEALARRDGVTYVRIEDRDDPNPVAFTADFIPTRLNLLVTEGKVARAGWG